MWRDVHILTLWLGKRHTASVSCNCTSVHWASCSNHSVLLAMVQFRYPTKMVFYVSSVGLRLAFEFTLVDEVRFCVARLRLCTTTSV